MSKVYHYNRISTRNQHHNRQTKFVDDYCEDKGLEITERVEEQISGKVDYKDRELSKLVDKMEKGDILIVAELSRLSRTMTDTINLIETELKQRSIKLIIADKCMEINCDGIGFSDKLILTLFAMFAEMEHVAIKERTQQGLAVVKEKLANGEVHTSKAGNEITKLGCPKEKWDINRKKGSAYGVDANMEKYHNNPLNAQLFEHISKGKNEKQTAAEICEEWNHWQELLSPDGGGYVLTEASVSKRWGRGY